MIRLWSLNYLKSQRCSSGIAWKPINAPSNYEVLAKYKKLLTLHVVTTIFTLERLRDAEAGESFNASQDVTP